MRSFFWCLTLLTVGLIACQTERPPTAEPIAVVLTATSSPTATGTAAPPTLTSTPRPTRAPTSTPSVTPTFTPYPTPLPTLPASSRSLDLTLVAQTGGDATGLALSEDGRLAYITVGPRLQVYDVADRANPTLQWQSEVFRQRFVDLAVVGEFGFGRLVDGWVVWRLSSAVPELLWLSDPEVIQDPERGERRRWTVLEEQVYLGISQEEWLVFDLAAPTFPLPTVTQAGQIYELDGGLVVVQGTAEQTTLLFAEGKTLPANVVGQLEIEGQHMILTTHQSYLYVASSHPNNADGLIVDISDLDQPTILVNDLAVYFPVIEKDGLWIGIYGDRAIYDVSQDPLHPRLLVPIAQDYLVSYSSILWQGRKLLMLSSASDAGYVGAGLQQLNIENVSEPDEQFIYRLPGLRVVEEIVMEDTLFILQNAQLTILDITDWEAISEIGRVELVGPVWRGLLVGDNIFLAAQNYNDFARLISNELTTWPTAISRIPVEASHNIYAHKEIVFLAGDGGLRHVNLLNNEVYVWEEISIFTGESRIASYGEYVVAIDGNKMVVIDLAEPSEPVIIGRYDSPRVQDWTNSLEQVRLINSVAFIASRYELTAVDLTDPTQPQEIGYWPMDETISSLFSIGEALYVGVENGNTLVFDVSIPTEPRLVQPIGTSISGHLYGNFLIGDRYIYDVADPLNPLLVGETGVFGSITGIRDNLLYVGSEGGVYVYEIRVRP
ncbi:MAG: hypothetical protein OT477_18250 [Chloroflexi bacterium]|nr:hypothetical protein [Chloroflexota bacterium]